MVYCGTSPGVLFNRSLKVYRMKAWLLLLICSSNLTVNWSKLLVALIGVIEVYSRTESSRQHIDFGHIRIEIPGW